MPLRDIAQTIAIIPRAVIEEQGATTLSDVLRNVPGITLQAGEGGGSSNTAGDMFNMRGFNASNSLFVDGVRDDGLISRDVFNLEQVEVFMGPTGSDVGRGTAAGYVNMQTKTPHARTRRTAVDRSVRHRRASARLTADINWGRPTAHQGSWLGKQRVSAQRRSGRTRGVPGRDEVDEREPGGGAVARARPRHADARDRWRAQIMRQDNLPDYGIPGAAWRRAADADDAPGPAAGRSEQLLRQPGFDYDKGRAGQLYRPRRARRQSQPDAAQPDPLQPRRIARPSISTIQNVAAFNAGDQSRDDRAAGQRAREHQ